MSIEIDHVFVFDEPSGPAAADLEAFGLSRGASRVHRGQGTANRCYFFDNCYLELIWVTDAGEVGGAAVQSLRLLQRSQWRERGTCPFGIALRTASVEGTPPPFDTFDYHAPYLPAGVSIRVAKSHLGADSPLIFMPPPAIRPSDRSGDSRGPGQGPGGFRQISHLALTVPAKAGVGAELKAIQRLGILEVALGDAHHLEIELDGARQRKRKTFLAALPITVCY